MTSLEQRVRQEVDTWEITAETELEYPELARTFLYGVGIRVTEKIIEVLEKEATQKDKNYLEFGYLEAVDEFRIDYFIWNYVQNGCNAAHTAQATGATRKTIWEVINKKRGTTLAAIKSNPEYFIAIELPKDIKDTVLNFAAEEIKKYSSVASFKIRELLRVYSKKMAARLVDVAGSITTGKKHVSVKGSVVLRPYVQLKYKEAMDRFKIDYLRGQFHNCGGNAIKAAERAGMTYRSYRETLDLRVRMGECKWNSILNKCLIEQIGIYKPKP